MVKVKVNCPLCGTLIGARSLDNHLERVHELTGLVTLRLSAISPYQYEPETEVVELAPPEGEEAEAEAAEAEAGENAGE